MRILFTLHNFFPEPLFGAEKAAILQMAELLRLGHTVGLFYAANREPDPGQLAAAGLSGLSLYPVPFYKTKGQVLLSAWKPHVDFVFKKALRVFKPDRVIFHHLVRLSLNLPAVAASRKIPTLFYLHDFYLVCPSYSLMFRNETLCTGNGAAKCAVCLYIARFGAASANRPAIPLAGIPFMLLRKPMLRKLIRSVDLFISPSQFLLAEIRRRGLPLKNAKVIPCGVAEISLFHGVDVPPMREITFGFMGNVHKKKGLDILAKAFEGQLGTHLVIRGFPDNRSLEDFKKRYPDLRAKLELYNPDKRSFFSQVDVVIVPSIWYENQPVVVIEAFQHGKPVICSDLGGMAEMVIPEQYGLLFKTGDPDDLRRNVILLKENPSEVARMAALLPSGTSVRENVRRLLNAMNELLSN